MGVYSIIMEITFFKHFEIIPDLRQDGKVKHKLIDILFIAVAGTIAGSDSWEDIEEFAEEREDWFKKYIELRNGIPSHDTIERTFSWIEPKYFEKAFISWAEELSQKSKGDIVAIDGKTARSTYDNQLGKSPIHIVSAWLDSNKMVLGQVKTDQKSNEITAIPLLLDMLFIKGCVVTIDAMGCQKDIAEKIIEKKADYVLALKGNQGNLHKDVVDYFDDINKSDFKDKDKFLKTIDKDHGRNEIRKYYLVSDISWLEWKDDWKNLKSIGMVIRECESNGKKTVETRYFITSIKSNVELFAKAVRKHWGVEITHWYLDVVFNEDKRRVRKNNSPQNLAMLKRLALNYVRKDTTSKKSLRRRRFKASLNCSYMEKILFSK